MKNTTERQFFILQRFVQIRQLPTNSQCISNPKKILLLKNVYNEQMCIMKIQPKRMLESRERNVLHQASFFQKFQGHIGVPLMIWSGQDFECLVLVIEQLGISIYDRMKNFCFKAKMRVKDACMIGIQMISIIKNFHQKDYIMKNITPETFCFGRVEKSTKIYISDLLYMKKFKTKNNLNHIQQRKQNSKLEFVTPFLSKNVLGGTQASRRDDLISIVYGKLPWQEDWQEDISLKKQEVKRINENQEVNFLFTFVPTESSEISSKILRMRQIQSIYSAEQLCRQLPLEIIQILNLVQELEFQEEPEYFRYIALLKKVLFRSKQKNDLLFQWMESKENFDNNMKAHETILNLQTFKQTQLSSLVYQAFQAKVNLEISTEAKIRKSVQSIKYSSPKKDKENPKKIKNFPYNKQTKKSNTDNFHQNSKNCQII